MKKLFFFLLLFAIKTNAQFADSSKLANLEQKLIQLEEKLFIADSVNYASQYNSAYEGYFLFQELQKNAIDFYSNIKNDIFLVELLNINNPNSLQLQKRIFDEMQQLVETKMYNILGKDSSKKKGLFKTIRNVFSHPIVNKIMGFVPMNNTISSILNTISGIILPEIKIEQNTLRKITSTDIDIFSVLDNTPLGEVTNKILPYMQFYDSLYHLNNRFSLQIDLYKNKASEIAVLINENKDYFAKITGWKPKATTPDNIDAYDAVFLDHKVIRNSQRFTVAQKQSMQQFHTFINPFIQENKKLNQLKEGYALKFIWFKKEYTRLLESFKSKSPLLEEILGPLLTKIKGLDDNNTVAVVSNPTVIQNANIPVSNPSIKKSDKEKRIDEINALNAELYWRNRGNPDSEFEAEKIKSVIF